MFNVETKSEIRISTTVWSLNILKQMYLQYIIPNKTCLKILPSFKNNIFIEEHLKCECFVINMICDLNQEMTT